MPFFRRVCFSFLLIGVFAACKETTPPEGNETAKILFIGNSYTYYNTGLDNVLQGMREAANMNGEYVMESVTQGGFTLQNHVSDATTQAKLLADDWDYVVLQEQSTRPINSPSIFLEYAGKLDQIIDSIGAQTTFFMTWAREHQPENFDVLESAYSDASVSLTAKLSPVGKAWEYSIAQNPLIDLYEADMSHPTPEGTYLAACIFYIVLFQESPVGNTYSYGSLGESTLETLQQTAEDFMEAY